LQKKIAASLKDENLFVTRVTAWESDEACASYIPEISR
jgi:hypothetical protein